MTTPDRRPLLPTWAASGLLLLAAGAAAGTILVLAQQNQQLNRIMTARQGTAGLEIGHTLPDLRLTRLSGETSTFHTLAEESGIVVVGFMTTTCNFCELNLPAWRTLRDDLARAGVTFSVLSLDSEDDARAFKEKHFPDWPIWIPAADDYRRLAPLSVPTTVVVGRDARILGVTTGGLDEHSIAELTERATVRNEVP